MLKALANRNILEKTKRKSIVQLIAYCVKTLPIIKEFVVS